MLGTKYAENGQKSSILCQALHPLQQIQEDSADNSPLFILSPAELNASFPLERQFWLTSGFTNSTVWNPRKLTLYTA